MHFHGAILIKRYSYQLRLNFKAFRSFSFNFNNKNYFCSKIRGEEVPLDKTFKCYSCLYFFAIVSAFGFLCFIHTKNRKSLKIILDFHFRLLCIYHDFIIELFDGKKLTNKNFLSNNGHGFYNCILYLSKFSPNGLTCSFFD